MRKSLLSLAVLSALSVPTITMAEEAAPAPAAAPASPHTIAYNVGLFSQYIFRGLTQTREDPALQGGVDYTHASGFYAGAWGSNISWLSDGEYYKSSSIELDVYGGFASTIGETGIGYNVGLLQYIYPGRKTPGINQKSAETTEVYGSLSYGWLTGKVSVVASDGAFGYDNADGSSYSELNLNVPFLDGYTAIAHYGYQDFTGKTNGASNSLYDYADWKLGVSKAFASQGVTIGGYYTDTDGKKSVWTDKSGQHLAKDQFTVFVQKTF